MHDIRYISENLELVKTNLKKRNFDTKIVDEAVDLNNKRKTLTTLVESKRAETKKISQEVGEIKKKGGDAASLMKQVADIKTQIESSEKELEEIQVKQVDLLSVIPNLLQDSVPVGSDEFANQELKKWGKIKSYDFTPIDHATLGEKLGLLDFETATKITGARFTVYKGQLARLERALISFMIDRHTDHGYLEILPPFIVHERSLYGTGNLPKFKDDLFKLEGFDWYLIPTAEVPVTNLKRDQIFEMTEFPLKYVAYTPCFRSEAGSAGRDTRGLIRQHQFNKVELVNIVAADKSKEAHEEMIGRACAILEELELPYRAMVLCSGDIGFGSSRTIDLEVWLPSQDKYREISSISNCWDFQARRAQIRYRNADGKPEYAHTLNGSGLAVGRTLVAIMENYQNKDGTITIPTALRPYMKNQEIIK
ncbi:MAG: serine--tRNA ligase [Bacteriovoracaceae bacterium]